MTEAVRSSPSGGYEEFVMTGDLILQVKSSPPSPKRKSRLSGDSNFSMSDADADAVKPAAVNGGLTTPDTHVDTSTDTHADSNSYDPMVTSDFDTQHTNNHNGNSFTNLECSDNTTNTNVSADDDASSVASDDSFPEEFIQTNFTEGGVVYGTVRKVDEPSAHRLAKRLFNLDGFKRSDVSYHLTRDNQFSRKVNEEYLKHFDFVDKNLVQAMRQFFDHFTLVGETQERERVLNHFTNRYLECNPSALNVDYNSIDACHTLTCAIMLLNTDLHGQNVGRRMTLNDFIENLTGLNGDDDFSKDMLKLYYNSIKHQELTWARDEHGGDLNKPNSGTHTTEMNGRSKHSSTLSSPVQNNPLSNSFLTVPAHEHCTEYKRGTLQKKHCKGPELKPVAAGKRGWKTHFVVLKGMALYLLKSSATHLEDKSTKVILLHHSLAQVDHEYKRKSCVFSLRTADWSEYLFSTSGAGELESWVKEINTAAALLSSEPLAAPVGAQKKFHRPLLPSSHSKQSITEQYDAHEQQTLTLKQSIADEEMCRPDNSASKQAVSYHKERMEYLKFELHRYIVYVNLLKEKVGQIKKEKTAIGEVEETGKSIASAPQSDNSQTGNINSTTNSDASAHEKAHDSALYSEDGMYIHLESEVTQL
ncbi:hypothetical protein EB796_005630 [Bugula neritina]|uniref:Uncharacterized protein n=1 Tax=Bugula neritina TaxID=10212 RepID=A0A7J7KCR3_BUGNE|nr:hypothetical protein EB796_005630 [Bugula neritina]